MKILVVGSGAREDTICKTLQKDPTNEVFCAPGNDGMKSFGIKIIDIKELEFEKLSDFVINNNIDYTVVGPEQPLVAGIVDYFKTKNLRIFGPSKNAAQIEGSKSFAKELMDKANIPTASFEEFTDFDAACKFLETLPLPVVIKADGLASGKGVYIIDDLNKGKLILNELLNKRKFSTRKVIIEEFLQGEEFSLMSFVVGNKFYPMPIAQDYKRILDDDQGLNTGGMGAICPVPNIDQKVISDTCENIIEPFVNEMYRNNVDYVGILYAGLIMTNDGVKVVEFNVRFGDPETEVVLPRLKTNLSSLFNNLIDNNVEYELDWINEGIDLGVFVASKGYPTEINNDKFIGKVDGFLNLELDVNFAGVKKVEDQFLTAGGRLYCLHYHSRNFEDARSKIYDFLDQQVSTNLFFRHDIGKNAI